MLLLDLFKPKPKVKAPLRFHNTLSGEKELFTPLSSRVVRMYNCGPTVYGTQHIGNMRAAVFADTIRRTLMLWGYRVQQVINLTDFGHLSSDADEGDDKMTVGLKREGMELTLENMRVLADRYAAEYFEDIEKLGVPLSQITFPRASNYIPNQISLIKALEEKGYAYPTEDGVYYDVSRFPAYGKLGRINLSGLEAGARVAASNKRGPYDFILWKSDKALGWQSPWGLGFPGWHIECTAMIFEILGKQIDIHTGGIEHIPVHHNNEIAQAEGATGKQFVKYWLHNDHITIEGKKISKSLGNTIYVHNITDRGINPLVLRYWFMTAHYKSSANFTWDALDAAAKAFTRLQRTFYEDLPKRGNPSEQFIADFTEALGNDLDTPKALALVWDMLRDTSVSPTQKHGNLLFADKVLDFGLRKKPTDSVSLSVATETLPEEVRTKVAAREEARANKNYAESDRLRDELKALGYEIDDKSEGPSVRKI